MLALAFVLQARRDFGQGAIAPKPGPGRGRYLGTWRLALNLNRGSLITWSITFVVLGFVFGFFATSINDLLGSDTAVQQALASGATSPETLVAAFLVTILSLLGIIASIPGVQIMVRIRTEEMNDRVEPIIATAVARPRYFASNVLLALGVPAMFILITGTVVALLASSADIGVDSSTPSCRSS